MKFWEMSAVVPLCVNEPSSATVKSILTSDPSMVVWWATKTECVSALVRQTRDGSLRSEDVRQARQVLGNLRTLGSKSRRAKYCVEPQNVYWPYTRPERLMRFS